MAISDEGKRSWSRAGARAIEVGSRRPTAEEAERTPKEEKEEEERNILGLKLLLVMGSVKLAENNCVQLIGKRAV